MPKPGKQKKAVKKGKKEHKNKPTSKKYSKYTIDGDNIKREKVCPRCGPGVFLMQADNRLYCGRCHYTEFTKQEKKESKPDNEEKSDSEKK